MTTKEWQQAGKYFPFQEHRIFFLEDGLGTTNLLLIHGFPTASWDFSRIWDGLLPNFRLIAPDMLGFGFSAKPYPHDYRIREQADLLEGLLSYLDVSQTTVLAHDYGDTVAQELLARQNEGTLSFRINRLGLLNGGLFYGTYRPRFIQQVLMSPIGPWLSPLLSQRSLSRTFRNIFGPDTQPIQEELDEFWRLLTFNEGKRVIPLLIRYMRERKIYEKRWTAALQQAGIPIRLIDGGADPISGAHMAEYYRQIIPDPDVVVLSDIGHYPQVESPGEVLEHFLSFALR